MSQGKQPEITKIAIGGVGPTLAIARQAMDAAIADEAADMVDLQTATGEARITRKEFEALKPIVKQIGDALGVPVAQETAERIAAQALIGKASDAGPPTPISQEALNEAGKHIANPRQTLRNIQGDCLACGAAGQAWVNPEKRFMYCFACHAKKAF